jgi:hypothetical protein
MSAFDWRQSVLPELENKKDFLLCPDDPRQTMYDVDDFTVYIVNNRRSIPLNRALGAGLVIQTFVSNLQMST